MFTTSRLLTNPAQLRFKVLPEERGQIVRCVKCRKMTRPTFLLPGQETEEGVLCRKCFEETLEDLG